MKHFDLNWLIGKNKSDAKKMVEDNDYAFRITSENGNDFMITCDFRMDRINVEIKEDIIINADFG